MNNRLSRDSQNAEDSDKIYEIKVAKRYSILHLLFSKVDVEIIKMNETLLYNISGDLLNDKTREVLRKRLDLIQNINQFIYNLLKFISTCERNLRNDHNIDKVPNRVLEVYTLIYLITKNYKASILQDLINQEEDNNDTSIDCNKDLKRIYNSIEYNKIKNSSTIFDEFTALINSVNLSFEFHCENLLKLYHEQKGFCLINLTGNILVMDHFASCMLSNSCSIGSNIFDVLSEKSSILCEFIIKKLFYSRTKIATYLTIFRKRNNTELSFSTNEMTTSGSLKVIHSPDEEDVISLNYYKTLEVNFSLILTNFNDGLEFAILLEIKNSRFAFNL